MVTGVMQAMAASEIATLLSTSKIQRHTTPFELTQMDLVLFSGSVGRLRLQQRHPSKSVRRRGQTRQLEVPQAESKQQEAVSLPTQASRDHRRGLSFSVGLPLAGQLLTVVVLVCVGRNWLLETERRRRSRFPGQICCAFDVF